MVRRPHLLHGQPQAMPHLNFGPCSVSSNQHLAIHTGKTVVSYPVMQNSVNNYTTDFTLMRSSLSCIALHSCSPLQANLHAPKILCSSSHLCLRQVKHAHCCRLYSLVCSCRSNLDSSERHLLKIGAITKAANGDLKATQLGQVLASLPVSLEFGSSIAAAVQHKCSHEVAVIACMATAAGNRVFQSDCQPAQSAFAAKSGDPETYLNIFEAWLGTSRNTAWCSQHRLISSALTAAEGLLTTVLAAMAHCNLSDVSFASSRHQTPRSDVIMQSLTMGFFQQTATSAGSGHRSQGHFFITDDYLTNPTSALLYNRSTLTAAASTTSMVLFFSRSMLADGRHVIAGVGQIQSD